MENIQNTQKQKNPQRPRKNKNLSLAGLLLIAIGIIIFVRISFPAYAWFPGWLFTWPMILIVIGVITGIRHNFRFHGWFILVLIGAYFLVSRQFPEYHLERFIAPFVLITIGLALILRPKCKRKNIFNGDDYWNSYREKWRNKRDRFTQPPPSSSASDATAFTTGSATTDNSSAEFLDVTSVLSSAKKTVFSKNFAGGDITCVFGGAEIDLSNADIRGQARLDITCFMGGAKLLVPSNWNVHSDVTVLLGGIDDKRNNRNVTIDYGKTLIIDGVCFMGGIEINSAY
jgi:predicted membrane protein